MQKSGFLMIALALLVHASVAQTPKSPYAGQESRDIKSLSDAEVNMYLSGAGMGLAKPAELNGYPGPMHVLDLASELQLSGDQRKQTEALFIDTKSRARALGEGIVTLERELDRLFAGGKADDRSLSQLVGEIGSAHAELRMVHLRAHLRQRSILTAEQTARYISLRGYEPAGTDGDGGVD